MFVGIVESLEVRPMVARSRFFWQYAFWSLPEGAELKVALEFGKRGLHHF